MQAPGIRMLLISALAGMMAVFGIGCSGGHLTLYSSAEAQDVPAPLRKVADVPLPGAAVRFDYQSFDPSHQRLYISHMNADQLVVFDTAKREVVANLDGFASVHGVLAVPEINRVYASVTGEHKVAVVEMSTLHTIAKVGPVKY